MIPFTDFSIEQIRHYEKIIKDRSHHLDKSNDKLKYFLELQFRLQQEELSRPIDEQFEKKNSLVQWDSIIEAEEDEEKRLIFVEVKGNLSNPRRGKLKLDEKIRRTYDIRKIIKTPLLESNKLSLKEKFQKEFFSNRHDSIITVIYASGDMKEEVQNAYESLATQINNENRNVEFWLCQCPRLAHCSINKLE